MAFRFSVFCDLLSTLEGIVAHDPPLLRKDREEAARKEAYGWFKSHRRAIDTLDARGVVALLSSLLPERRTDRVYGLQAATLSKLLSRTLRLNSWKAKDLTAYKQPGFGDLAECLERVLKDGGPPALPIVTLEEIDGVLLGLAQSCSFSDPAIRLATTNSLSRHQTNLANIFHRLHPRESKWLVRLILKDFSPVRLDDGQILRSIHFLLPDILRFQQDFEAAAATLKGPFKAYPSCPDPQSGALLRKLVSTSFRPTVGVKVARSEFCKARSIDQCVKIADGRRWMLERKYDGEYCEIHIDLSKGNDWLKIFSKSGKDSTQDRQGLVDTIRKCLQIGSDSCKVKQRCILLGEMVVYSDQDKQVSPFHKIRKHVSRSGVSLGTSKDSQPHDWEHLMIIFFDLLLLDDNVSMHKPLEERKGLLNGIYKKRLGRAMTAESKVIDFSENDARRKLMSQFAASVAARHEGLVLKPCGQPYFSLNSGDGGRILPIMKLKKDYIAGLGDEADFAVVGATYKAQEALRSGGSRSFTHFHLGCLTNKGDVLRFQARPCFKVVGTIALEQCIPVPVLDKASDAFRLYGRPYVPGEAPISFDLRYESSLRIDVVIDNPIVFEVLGSSFDKNSNTDFWMLRHPRVKKLHHDRTWRDCISFNELQDMAKKALSAPEDSESQENIRWMDKIERSCKRKIARASNQTTPATIRTISPVSIRQARTLKEISPNELPTPPPSSPTRILQQSKQQNLPEQCIAVSLHACISSISPPKKRKLIETTADTAVEAANQLHKRPQHSYTSPPPSSPPQQTRHSLNLPRKPSPHKRPFTMTCTGTCASLANRADHTHPFCHLSDRTIYVARPHYPSPDANTEHTRLQTHYATHGATIIPSLAHWDRDSFAHPPLSATVSESMSHPGLTKTVIIPTSDWLSVLAAVEHDLLALNNGAFRERVEVYVGTGVLEPDACEAAVGNRELGFDLHEGLEKQFQRGFLGALEWDAGLGKAVWVPVERVGRWLARSEGAMEVFDLARWEGERA